ncbi:MAG: NTP transferase domain-containing protein [Pseudomonadota bacterium]
MRRPSEPHAVEVSKPAAVYVLAGARASGDALAEAHGVPSKAHIKTAGRSMISWVLEAVSKSEHADGITVIGLADQQKLTSDETWPSVNLVEGADGPAASVSRALDAEKWSGPVLVTTCDHALLTPAMIDAFVSGSIASEAELTVGLARREDIESKYPDVARTYLRFDDGAYSSCNLFCLNAPAAQKVVEFWRTAEQDRKRPWRIAWRFGVIAALRILVGRPDVEKVFAIVSRRLGVSIRPVILPFAEAAIDVDTEEDLALVERILLERRA